MARAYSQFTTSELGRAVRAAWDNADTLLSLDHELSFRARPQAKRLHVEVVRRINELTGYNPGASKGGDQPDLFPSLPGLTK